MDYILVNEKSGEGKVSESIEKLKKHLNGKYEVKNVLEIKDYRQFFSSIEENDRIILCGGDGTLNHFINDTSGLEINQDVYMFSSGSGNDFLFDLEVNTEQDGPVLINKYLEKLPVVEVNGIKKVFINGVGYGVDGYCCQVADQQKAEGKKDINYAAIAVTGILSKFSPRNATVRVDGNEYKFDHVWIAASMNGRAYGGGLLCAPYQDRLNEQGTLSLVVYRGRSRVSSLIKFTTIFKGKHIKYRRNTYIISGKSIEVEFDRPSPLQIDGETILDVSRYKVYSVR